MKSIHILLTALLCAVGQLCAADAKPNILFIVADDMGYADCGVQGCKDVLSMRSRMAGFVSPMAT